MVDGRGAPAAQTPLVLQAAHIAKLTMLLGLSKCWQVVSCQSAGRDGEAGHADAHQNRAPSPRDCEHLTACWTQVAAAVLLGFQARRFPCHPDVTCDKRAGIVNEGSWRDTGGKLIQVKVAPDCLLALT